MPIKFKLLRNLQALVIEDSSSAKSVGTIKVDDNVFLEKEFSLPLASDTPLLLVVVHNPRERVRRYLIQRDKLVNSAKVLTRKNVLDGWHEVAAAKVLQY